MHIAKYAKKIYVKIASEQKKIRLVIIGKFGVRTAGQSGKNTDQKSKSLTTKLKNCMMPGIKNAKGGNEQI